MYQTNSKSHQFVQRRPRERRHKGHRRDRVELDRQPQELGARKCKARGLQDQGPDSIEKDKALIVECYSY